MGTFVYILIGVIVAVISYYIVDLIVPGEMDKQIADEENIPIVVVAAAMILGICIVIAASMFR